MKQMALNIKLHSSYSKYFYALCIINVSANKIAHYYVFVKTFSECLVMDKKLKYYSILSFVLEYLQRYVKNLADNNKLFKN